MPRRSRPAGVDQALEQLKFEASSEIGVQTGADQTSRNNGAVGGNMVRKLIQIAESQLSNRR